VSEQHFSYPLRLNYSFVVNADGTATQITSSDQRDLERESHPDADGHVRTLDNQVHATDTLQFDASFHILGNSGSQTTQSYRSQDLSGGCYSRTLTAQAQSWCRSATAAAATSSGQPHHSGRGACASLTRKRVSGTSCASVPRNRASSGTAAG